MPHRSHDRGTFVLDRVFAGVGRVRLASGTTDRRLFERLNDMLTELFRAGRLDVLVLLRDRALTPRVAYERFRRRGLEAFSEARMMVPLREELARWLASVEASPRHRRNLESSVRLLLAEADAGETLSGLASVLRRYRERARPRQFNLVRSAVQAFVRDRFGRRSALYAEVSDVPPRPYRPQPGRPLSPQALSAFGLPEPLAGMVWTMALTGMGPAEYWGSWTLRLDRVEIHGTKRPGRERVVPRVGSPEVPSWTYWHTQRAFRERTGHGLYDLRRSYAGWLEEAGVPITRVRAYLGHGPSSVTDRYLWREVESHLREDAARLMAYLSAHGASERVAVSL